ncbi:hypothetical protein QYF61_015365 [Mycteria americana]|uniref:Uncharacterized protein n=1 Tax=Mycteria americana TaxID=33587 RepID=A0AAN7MP48_MYCAM|nr:hypothetical protein QYF61_015365 [Mycteria americana]
MACYLGEETDPHLSTPSFQAVVESDEVSPQPPFLQAEQPQVPQPLPISLVLQTLPQLRCPSLDTLQPLNVSLVVGGPTLNTAFEVRPHQCQVQGDNHCPSPAGHAISDTSQDATGLLGHLGTLLAHVQPAVDQHPQVLFHRAVFQPLFSMPVALHGVVVAQVQDLALLNLIQLALAHRPSLSRSLIKILNRTGPSTEPWGTPLVNGRHLDLTPFTTTLWAQPSSSDLNLGLASTYGISTALSQPASHNRAHDSIGWSSIYHVHQPGA